MSPSGSSGWADAARRWVTHLRPVRKFSLFSAPEYRLPFTGAEGPAGVETRRSDYALWYLRDNRLVEVGEVRVPTAVSYEDLLRVHTASYLESLNQPGRLADIFAVDPSDVPVDALLHALRLACGGTLAAAREALASSGRCLNLLGGFHHAGPSRGGGFCALNDVAVAIRILRAEGWQGRVAILDLDAHPPDGTRACLERDAAVWMGSISGCDWGPLPGVDETVLPVGSGDEPYRQALASLLTRLPAAELTFILSGADVLAGDHLGALGLSLGGARTRDILVDAACHGRPSVWLPAGGYSPQAWRVLAGTALVLAGRGDDSIPADYNPLHSHFAMISQSLDAGALSGGLGLSEDELGQAMRLQGAGKGGARYLGYYTLEGLELALEQYGVLPHLRRLGYGSPRLVMELRPDGERLELLATAAGREHLLIDLLASRESIAGSTWLFTNWLTLRNPRASFSERRPRLPGQEVPGLGIALEVSELLGLMSQRLGLAGVAFRPSSYHVAFASRHRFRFLDPERQARFEALVRDLGSEPLVQITAAIEAGRVMLDGAPYAWEAELMVQRPGPAVDEARIAAAQLNHRFTLSSPAA